MRLNDERCRDVAARLMQDHAIGVEFLSISEHCADIDLDADDEDLADIGDLIRSADIAITWPDDPAETAVITWDYREQLPPVELAAAMTRLTGGRLSLHEIDTRTDQYAIVLSTTPLDRQAARKVWAAADPNATEEG